MDFSHDKNLNEIADRVAAGIAAGAAGAGLVGNDVGYGLGLAGAGRERQRAAAALKEDAGAVGRA